MAEPVLELHNVSCETSPGQPLFENVSFSVNEGDIIVLQGNSGCGKTTLLKCIAHLLLHKGKISYRGSTNTDSNLLFFSRTPQAHGLQESTNIDGDDLSPFPTIGIPAFRARVLYVPQRPSLLPGTPRDFLYSVLELKSHRTYKNKKLEKDTPQNVFDRAVEVGSCWGVEADLWQREWSNLSGGEAQRIALAVALALNTAEILLLDEPTSALDPRSSSMVEEYLLKEVKSVDRELKALIWITHSEEQAKRVGTRFFNFLDGGCKEECTSV